MSTVAFRANGIAMRRTEQKARTFKAISASNLRNNQK